MYDICNRLKEEAGVRIQLSHIKPEIEEIYKTLKNAKSIFKMLFFHKNMLNYFCKSLPINLF